MAVTIDATSSDAMADALNGEISTAHELRLYDSGDTLLATLTYAASQGSVGVVSGAAAITYSEASYTDDETPASAGTVNYATIHRTAATGREVIRFTNPQSDIGLSSVTISTSEPVRVTTDIVIKLPNST